MERVHPHVLSSPRMALGKTLLFAEIQFSNLKNEGLVCFWDLQTFS